MSNLFVDGVSAYTTPRDSAANDPFGRLRISDPLALFDCQLTYDLQPLILEPVTNATGATITHDTTNRAALMGFSNTVSGGLAYVQSYEHFRYQPGRGQIIFLTFNMQAHTANVLKFAGYSDGTNGVELQSNGSSGYQFTIYSGTGAGQQTVTQANWNLDKLNGSGASGLTLNVATPQILVIDLQALYVGRVRCGFDIDGKVYYAHEFLNANRNLTTPYIQTANLPIRCGMSCNATVTANMSMYCASVSSEGGSMDQLGYNFAIEGTVTAANGSRTHILSVRPKTTFNSITNRSKFVLESIDFMVTGTNPIVWELVIGDVLTGTTTFANVNTTYSSTEYNTAGTTSAAPAVVLTQGYVPATAGTKTTVSAVRSIRFPLALTAAGALRGSSMSQYSVLVTGVGGTSATRCALNWREIR
jgi:hypothetical protein